MEEKHELRLISSIPPSVNHYIGYRAIPRKGRYTAMSYCLPEARAYKKAFSEYVASEVVRQGWNLKPNKAQHFYVDTVFYFPTLRLDANNYFKCMLDAITDTQLIWIDDNVVCERVNGIFYDSSNPRVELHIHPVDYIGVFENSSQLAEFEANCIGCVRDTRNCSIRVSAKEGRIQKEIKDGVCLCRKQRKSEKVSSSKTKKKK